MDDITNQVKQSKASNVYKDPTAVTSRPAAKRQVDEDGNLIKKVRKIDPSMHYDGPLERTVRESTKAITQTVEEANRIRAKEQEQAKKIRQANERPTKVDFRQKDLLMEALDTEVSALMSSTSPWLGACCPELVFVQILSTFINVHVVCCTHASCKLDGSTMVLY